MVFVGIAETDLVYIEASVCGNIDGEFLTCLGGNNLNGFILGIDNCDQSRAGDTDDVLSLTVNRAGLGVVIEEYAVLINILNIVAYLEFEGSLLKV